VSGNVNGNGSWDKTETETETEMEAEAETGLPDRNHASTIKKTSLATIAELYC